MDKQKQLESAIAKLSKQIQEDLGAMPKSLKKTAHKRRMQDFQNKAFNKEPKNG